mgnify:CR=1 FL=1
MSGVTTTNKTGDTNLTATVTSIETPSVFHEIRPLYNNEKLLTCDALMKYNDTLVDLHERSQNLAERMTRLAHDFEEGRSINSLGEIGYEGLRYDQLCAVLYERKDTLERVAKAEGVTDEKVAELMTNARKRLAEITAANLAKAEAKKLAKK